MCADFEVLGILGLCFCTTCCYCLEDVDNKIQKKLSKIEDKEKRAYASAASKTKAAVVTQPKSINATPKEPEKQPLKSTNKENIDGTVPMPSPTLELSTQSQAERIS